MQGKAKNTKTFLTATSEADIVTITASDITDADIKKYWRIR